ncbi:MAG: helix-turn-helix domain-containing protein [Lachnospiraceae bacterium]|nr:helix-turn-helix domain-containing protein [Lachnospiraceae bacterium]
MAQHSSGVLVLNSTGNTISKKSNKKHETYGAFDRITLLNGRDPSAGNRDRKERKRSNGRPEVNHSAFLPGLGMSANRIALRNALFESYLKGEIALSGQENIFRSFESDYYKLVIFDHFSDDGSREQYDLSEFLCITEEDENAYDSFRIHDMNVLLLRSRHIIENLEGLMRRLEGSEPPEENSPIGSLMLFAGNTLQSLEELPASFSALEQRFAKRFFIRPGSHVIREDSPVLGRNRLKIIEDRRRFLSDLIDDYTERMSVELQTLGKYDTLRSLEEYEKKLTEYALTDSEVRSCSIIIYNNLIRNLLLLGVSLSDQDNSLPGGTEAILNSSYLQEIHSVFTSLARQCANARSFTSDNIIDDIIDYIDTFYNENITLEKIAPLFGYNSSYLGKIINRKLGRKLGAYLDEVRIQKASALLKESDLHVYKVAELVGYRNVDYFHVKFKRYTGLSPAEYRKSIV